MLAHLRSLQLADSAFPLGMFAHSHGLEAMVRRNLVTNADELERLVRVQLEWSVVPSDGVALLNARAAAEAGCLQDLVAMDRLLFAMRWASELRAASVQAGRRLLAESAAFPRGSVMAGYREAAAGGSTPGCGAVALGVVAWESGIPGDVALAGYLHSLTLGTLNAGQRLLSITHSQSQQMLARAQPLMMDLIRSVEDRSWQDMCCFTPELDIAAAGHEIDEVRMFAS
ncbi:MAG: hypothetical protein EXR51_06360 [Dehalococcoidia bacterium]|nr:hypothetical protein [Dehalococcoidia bacterium]